LAEAIPLDLPFAFPTARLTCVLIPGPRIGDPSADDPAD